RNVQQIVSESQRLGSARVSRAVADVSSTTTSATSATYSRRRLPHFERPMNTRDECATRDKLLRAKKLGFSDRQLAVAGGAAENGLDRLRHERQTLFRAAHPRGRA